MKKRKSYISQFVKDSREVGAVAPSSKSLGRKICSYIDFERSKVIMELGPGNGVFTKLLLERMRPDAQLIAFETNQTFCDIIKTAIQDERLILINDSAEKINKYLDELGHDEVDYVVSSLPYTVIPKEVKHNILDACAERLSEKGLYLQFQYSLNALGLLKSKFGAVNYSFSLLNFPPAFVYRCTSPSPVVAS